MDIPNKRDWFNISAIVPLLAVLFTSSFGLFARAVMSLEAKILWILATIIMAFLVWLNAAKNQQCAREDREHALENRERLDKIIRLLSNPDTTVEDIRMAATGPLSNTPLASSSAQAEVHKWWE